MRDRRPTTAEGAMQEEAMFEETMPEKMMNLEAR